MASATLTMIGLYNQDNTLFDLFTVPESVDKPTLINNILLRSGEFEVLYPDPNFMKFSLGEFSKAWQPTFERWANALALEYNPLENYDRKEDWTDTKNGNTSGTTTGRTNSTTTDKVSAYDAGDDLTTRGSNILVGADSSSNSSEAHEGAKHDGRIHGNIGVTTSQQMLQSELDLGYWNIYEKITDLVLTHFVLPVY